MAATDDATDPAMRPLIEAVEREFGTMMLKARDSLRERAAAIDTRLHPLGYKVVSVLANSGGQQQAAVAEALQVDKAMMSRTVKQLEEYGLLVRTPDPADGRAMLMTLTDSAATRYRESVSAARALLYERLAGWGADDVARFADLLARLNASGPSSGASPGA
ncbi:MarR family winged helix-turn-helix transcriptional regulator [Specibacter cremeus]|uniref:MarR family winged helix-turn-helix transcriptional regulator n=1 Tax=Specibacter cremeus TaxID=1629051 RepID=UPI0013DE43BD|nr:MarR family transcriptional regulator [Specibacter cremeus]